MKRFDDTKMGKWFAKHSLIIMLIILTSFVVHMCNGQISHHYIGSTYTEVLQEIKGKTDDVDIIKYDDNSIGIYAYFDGLINGAYTFDTKQKCVFYIVTMPDTIGQSILIQELNKRCFYFPRANEPKRWIDTKSPRSSIWKIQYSTGLKMFILVMDTDLENEITKSLQNELNY